jgi:NADPH:quinone reductase-like Zn-dependent oxidoreductase
MRALIFTETGEPNSVLKLAEIPTPPLARGEALVRVLLTPIHPSDLHMLRGRYGYQPELPASPGIRRGMVEALGPGVQGPTVGTRVIFVGTWHTWREQIICPVDRLVPVPDGLDEDFLNGGARAKARIGQIAVDRLPDQIIDRFSTVCSQ